MNHEGMARLVYPIAAVTMGNAVGRDLFEQCLAHGTVERRSAEARRHAEEFGARVFETGQGLLVGVEKQRIVFGAVG
ncbi:hypothetical protein D3C85_1660980 [compost metagenome]